MTETPTIELLPLFSDSRDSQLRAIATARRALSDSPYDINLAIFIIRGLPVVKACGVLDLVWTMYEENATMAETTEILDRLQAKLEEEEHDGATT